MRILLLIFISIIFSFSPTLADGDPKPQKISYKEYLSEVLAYYPALKKEHASIEKAIAQKALAASRRMPKFWASVQSEYGNDPVYVFGALLRQNKFTSDDFALKRLNTPSSYTDNAAGISSEWLLFDFSQTSARIKAAGILTESAKFQAQWTKMEAILAASEIYSRLSSTDAYLDVLEKEVASAQADVASAESLNRRGLALGADFYLARMTQTQLLQMKNETTAQRAALAMVFNVLRGRDPATPMAVALDFDKPVTIKGGVQEWIQKAVNNRLDVKAMEKMLEASGVGSLAERRSIFPKVAAYGGANEHVHSIGQGGGGNYMVGIKVKMDVFDPGYVPRVKMAREEVNRLSAEYQERRDQAAQDMAEVYYRLQALESNIQLAKNTCRDAMQATRLLEPLYREGQRSIQEMLSIRSQSVAAGERWLKLASWYRQGILTLKFYSGELTPDQAEAIYGP